MAEKSKFVLSVNGAQHPEQYEEVRVYGTVITYKTLRAKLTEKARIIINDANASFFETTGKDYKEHNTCYKVIHPDFPGRVAYAYVLSGSAYIFV